MERVVEGVLGGTILAAQKLVDAGIAVSGCFRGLGSDWDTTLEDGLNEYEAENDGLDGDYLAVSPDGYYGIAEMCDDYVSSGDWAADCAASVVPPQQMPDAGGDASPEPSPSASPFVNDELEYHRGEVIGCGKCDSWPWVIRFPNGIVRFICDEHGVIGRSHEQVSTWSHIQGGPW